MTARPATRWLIVLVLTAVVGGYALVVAATRDRWATTTHAQEHNVVTYEPMTDAAPSAESVTEARDVVTARVAALGVPGARVIDADPAAITVTVPVGPDSVGPDSVGPGQLRALGAIGRLSVRPVVQVVAAQWVEPPPPTAAPDPQRLADEKDLRQNTNPQIQLLALQFQASKCDAEDVLAGRDDPELPLATCGADGEAFLLDPELIAGDQIRSATSGYNERAGQDSVDVEFTDEAADRWAEFTAANIGSQVAFTVDTWVVSAPQILEEIAGGSTQIAGGFTAEEARTLAAVLTGGTLPYPLAVASSDTEIRSVSTYSTGWRIGLIVAGVLVVLVVAGAALTVRRRNHAAAA